jgi:PRC-barrel domain
MRKPAMLQKLLITTAASCMIISSALAQSAQPQTETAPVVKDPVVKEQTVPEAKQTLGSVSSDRFIKEQGADQWVFTKFKGTDVLGPDNARVGSVDDLLFDKNGKIIGMVVGVGGFLGLGVKNVAIGMSAFDVIPADIGGDRSNARANDPTSVKLKVSWTKDQLMEAPDFQYFKPATRSATIPPPATTGAAPRPIAPAAPAAPR